MPSLPQNASSERENVATIAAERDRMQALAHDLGERVKELSALHEAARLLQDDRLDIQDTLQRVAALIPPAFQYPASTACLVRYGDISVQTPGFEASPSLLARPFETRDGTTGTLEVVCLSEQRAVAEGPFLAEERRLIHSLAEMLISTLERREAQVQLRRGERRLNAALDAASADRDRTQLLLQITNAVVSELDMKRLLVAISRLLRETIQHHFASVTLWDDAAGTLRRHALVFPSGKGAIADDTLLGEGSPALRAFALGSTVTLVAADIDALGGQANRIMVAEGLRAVCCVPLITPRGTFGTLNVGKPDDVPFSSDEVTLLEQVARQVALAIENAISFRRAESYRREAAARSDRLQLLLDVNNALVTQLESHALRLSVLGTVRRVIDHDYASLSIFDKADNQLCLEAVTFYDERGVMEPRLKLSLDGSPAGRAFQSRTTRVFSGAELDRFGDEGVPLVRTSGMRSVCGVPLITQRGAMGVLIVARRDPAGFTADEVELLGEVAGQVAIAVENTLAYQEISTLKDRLTDEKLYLEDEITERHDFNDIVGSSGALSDVLRQIRTVAPTDATVLLLGETGTGKELLARALHAASLRQAQTFVRVNGAALPAGLVESELFGYERGAFSGAVTAKAGRFELANRGTLFLDEVGDIPLEVQPKLLRALQEQEFERLGSTRTQRVDVRVIAATHRDLGEMVAQGAFRSDLFYRLSVFPIQIPALRERPDDIPALVHHFVRKFSRELGRTITTIPAAAMDTLKRWEWPGNIRELENLIERAVILSTGGQLHVPADVFQGSLTRPAARAPRLVPAPPQASSSSYAEGEREIILRALRDANGIIAGADGAASRLGLKRTTLHSKMRKLGIARPRF